jgi:hypothetical protein
VNGSMRQAELAACRPELVPHQMSEPRGKRQPRLLDEPGDLHILEPGQGRDAELARQVHESRLGQRTKHQTGVGPAKRRPAYLISLNMAACNATRASRLRTQRRAVAPHPIAA